MTKIGHLYKEWLALQPISPENEQRLKQKFMLEFNYNSNHIEGNTLTYGQTEFLLMFGKVEGDAKMHDLEEMKAHNVGLIMMQTEASDIERPLTEYFIRELHRTLLREDYNAQRPQPDGSTVTYTVHAGVYKTRPNSVITATGERFEYASPEETPALMSDLIDWYNQAAANGNYTPIELASLFHYRYIRIHPFEDGNGRIARLLVNFILLRHNYPMIVIKSDNKEKYLNALNKSDINVGFTPSDGAYAELEQIQPFVEYMTSCLERALNICIRAAKGENIEDMDDWRKNLTLKYQDKLNKPELTVDIQENILKNFKSLLQYIDAELTPFYSICNSAFWLPSAGNYLSNGDDLYTYHVSSLRCSHQNKIQLIISISLVFEQFCYHLIVNAQNTIIYKKDLSYLSFFDKNDYERILNEIGGVLNKYIEGECLFTPRI